MTADPSSPGASSISPGRRRRHRLDGAGDRAASPWRCWAARLDARQDDKLDWSRDGSSGAPCLSRNERRLSAVRSLFAGSEPASVPPCSRSPPTRSPTSSSRRASTTPRWATGTTPPRPVTPRRTRSRSSRTMPTIQRAPSLPASSTRSTTTSRPISWRWPGSAGHLRARGIRGGGRDGARRTRQRHVGISSRHPAARRLSRGGPGAARHFGRGRGERRALGPHGHAVIAALIAAGAQDNARATKTPGVVFSLSRRLAQEWTRTRLPSAPSVQFSCVIGVPSVVLPLMALSCRSAARLRRTRPHRSHCR